NNGSRPCLTRRRRRGASTSRARPPVAPSNEAEVAIEEREQLVDHGLLLCCVTRPCPKTRDGGHDARDRRSAGGHGSVAERVIDEGPGFVGPKLLLSDDLLKLV